MNKEEKQKQVLEADEVCYVQYTAGQFKNNLPFSMIFEFFLFLRIPFTESEYFSIIHQPSQLQWNSPHNWSFHRLCS